MPVLRPLTEGDAPALAAFTCESFRQPWTTIVQEMIRGHLAENLSLAALSAVGLWLDDALCGVAAWRI
jgi:hypothetical protein